MRLGVWNAESPCCLLHYWLPKRRPLPSIQEMGRIFCEESDQPKKKNLKAKELYISTCTLVGKFVSYRVRVNNSDYFIHKQVLNK